MKQAIERYLAGIARDLKLGEGAAGIKRILVQLHRKGNASIRDVADATRLPPPVVSLVLTKLSADGLVHRDKSGGRFTEKGMRYVEAEMGIWSLGTVSCDACGGTGYELDLGKRHSRLFERLEAVARARPDADVTVDQAMCTADTLARRLLLLHSWHAFDGNALLFLGDDDFVSVAACAPEFTEDYFVTDPGIPTKPFHATVLDVDTRILGRIGELASQMVAGNLSTVAHDLRKPLPEDLRHRFDAVFTDPPYTLNGCKLFLSRAIDALHEGTGSRVFLSFGHVSPGTMHEIQSMIVRCGLVIEAIIPGFNRYEGGNIIGNMSQMLVLTLVDNGRPPVAPDAEFTGDIYTAGPVFDGEGSRD
ncbi:MAG: bis-aminopropyl spermidine synthase family protein [Candidatus Lokiarchaeota archaeon]|nr:bis-aminopropyl spermidine synthase family protein [Candidatus Lokiarchaeota archaeon]